MATEFIRVKSKSTGHEYSLPADAFDPEAHKKVSGPAEEYGVLVPPVISDTFDAEPVDETVVPAPVTTTKKA